MKCHMFWMLAGTLLLFGCTDSAPTDADTAPEYAATVHHESGQNNVEFFVGETCTAAGAHGFGVDDFQYTTVGDPQGGIHIEATTRWHFSFIHPLTGVPYVYRSTMHDSEQFTPGGPVVRTSVWNSQMDPRGLPLEALMLHQLVHWTLDAEGVPVVTFIKLMIECRP